MKGNRSIMMARYAARVLLGAVFCVSAVTKFVSMESFELYLFSFQFFSFDVCSVLARLLVTCELLLGLGLASGFFRRTVNWLCALMLAAFTVFLAWRMALGDQDSCHCFGDVLDMNPLQSLVKNLVFAAFLAAGWDCFLPSFIGRLSLRLRILIASLAAAASLATIFAVNAPDMYFRLKNGSSDYITPERWEPVAQQVGCTEGRHVVMLLSPFCEHCQRCTAKVARLVERHGLDAGMFHIVFMDPFVEPGGDYDKLTAAFFKAAGVEDPGFPRDYIPYDDYIRLTRGLQPFVCLYDGMEKLAEYDVLTLDEGAVVKFLTEE